MPEIPGKTQLTGNRRFHLGPHRTGRPHTRLSAADAGARIVAFRQERGWASAELASAIDELCSMTEPRLLAIERGEVELTKLSEMLAIAWALGRSLGEVFYDSDGSGDDAEPSDHAPRIEGA